MGAAFAVDPGGAWPECRRANGRTPQTMARRSLGAQVSGIPMIASGVAPNLRPALLAGPGSGASSGTAPSGMIYLEPRRPIRWCRATARQPRWGRARAAGEERAGGAGA